MKRILVVLISMIIHSCGNSPLLIVNENRAVRNAGTTTEDPSVDIVERSTSNSGLRAIDFGARGDAVQLDDFKVEGNIVTSESAKFSNADVGKIISIAYAGKNEEHLLSNIRRVIDSKKVEIRDKAFKNVTNSLGSYGTDNIVYLQNAINEAIAKNKTLYVDEGIYLIGDVNKNTGKTALFIEMTSPRQSFRMKGAGKNRTIFRELDGKTQRYGRYTKIFYHYLNNFNSINTIELSSFALDKNGRSLTKNPSELYTWEQAHAWSWAARKDVRIKIDSIILKNLEIIDKIGAGINFSSSEVTLGSVLIDSITEKNFNGNKEQSINYGHRGDLEISCFSDNIIMQNLKLRYIQIEPVRSMSANKNRQRRTVLKNSIVNSIDYTESDNGDSRYSFLTVDNVTSYNFLVRSIRFKVSNSTLTVKNLINSVDGHFYKCKFLLPYDSQNNEITSINNSYLRTLGLIKNRITYDSCSFVIDNSNLNIKPKGYAMTASSKVDQLDLNTILVKNSTFDKRLESTVNAYGNGTWSFTNNILSGRENIIVAGGYKNFTSKLLLANNKISDFSLGKIFINNHNSLWSINISDEDPEIAKRLKFKKPGKFNKTQIID